MHFFFVYLNHILPDPRCFYLRPCYLIPLEQQKPQIFFPFLSSASPPHNFISDKDAPRCGCISLCHNAISISKRDALPGSGELQEGEGEGNESARNEWLLYLSKAFRLPACYNDWAEHLFRDSLHILGLWEFCFEGACSLLLCLQIFQSDVWKNCQWRLH